MEYNSGSNGAKTILNYEHDFSLNCTTRGSITNSSVVTTTNFGIKNVFWKFFCAKISVALFKIVENCAKHCRGKSHKSARNRRVNHVGIQLQKSSRPRDRAENKSDREFCYIYDY